MTNLTVSHVTRSKEKFYGIDVVRGAATCLVAVAHGSWRIAEPRYFGRTPFHGVLDGLVVAVDFFFVLSGFLIAWVHWRDIGQPSRIENYFKRRLSRIYPVYWTVITSVLLIHLVHPSVTATVTLTPKIVITSYLILPNGGPTILGVAWTLYFEVFCYLVFAMIIGLGRVGFAIVGFWALTIVGYNLLGWPRTFPLYFFLNGYNLQFLAGICAAAFVRHYTIPMPRLIAVLGSALFIFFVDLNPRQLIGDNDLLMRGTFGLFACMIIIGLIQSERAGTLRIPLWLQNFGAASYSIYLVHTIVQPPILQYGWPVIRQLGPNLATIVVTALAVFVGYLFHLCVELPVTRIVQKRVVGASMPKNRAEPVSPPEPAEAPART